MRLRVLGTVEVDDAAVRSAGIRRLLAMLALDPGRVVPADRLVEHLWPGDPPAHGEAALHSLVARARRVLGDGALRTRPPGYALDLPAVELDAAAVADLRERARDAPPEGAAALLDEALALWRGPALAEFADDEPFRPVAARLAELHADTEDARARADLDLGRPGAAVARLTELVAAAPLRERRRELLVEALHRAGRGGDALAAVAAYRRLLAEELGLDPGPELRRLEAAVLAGDRVPENERHRRSTDSKESAVRSPAVAMVGRETALAEVVAVLGAGPVTLVGPGGVGKTTLARHVAAAAGSSFPDGVVVAELAAVAIGTEVAPAVVAAVGAPGASAAGTDPRARIAAVLRGRRVLLVLDNAEHVVDAVADVVTGLAATCPTVTVLTTSREPLGVPEERVRPVPPLSEAAAVALFVERATRADPSFVASDRSAVAEVCRRLDRLPLALELAAARMRVLSPAELVDDLPTHLRFLRSPHRAADRRHRTLHAVVDWSFRLLDEREQALLARLGVFAGAFTRDAARAVAGDEAVDAALADLVDKSLVTAVIGHPTRYALLETVRAYARERLDERGETATYARRHAEQTLAGLERRPPIPEVEAQWDELRAAVAWADGREPSLAASIVARLADVAEVRMTPELFGWADRLLDGERALGPDRAGVHAVAAAGARFAGDLARAEEQLAAGRRAPAGPAGPYLAYLAAEVDLFAGRVAECAETAAEAERLATAAGDQRLRVVSASTRVLALAYAGGSASDAVTEADALDATARALGDPLAVPWTTYIAGEVRADTDPHAALDLIDEAVDRARAADERYALGVALVTATSLRARGGDPVAAARSAADCLEHWRGTGNRTQQWVGLRTVVDLLADAGHDDAAAELLGGLDARRSGGAVFGPDAARLAAQRDALVARLGPGEVARAGRRGAARDDDALVDLARGALAGLAGPSDATGTDRSGGDGPPARG